MKALSRSTPAIGVLACAACVSTGRPASDAAMPAFDPIAFFAGHTHGAGVLRTVFHRSRPAVVDGVGRLEPDGTIVLDQTVRLGTQPPTHRSWRLRRAGPGRYLGTLTDAVGPVTGETEGGRLHLGFRTKSGLRVDQWLSLDAGGGGRNVLLVAKMGMPVARLDETITRLP